MHQQPQPQNMHMYQNPQQFPQFNQQYPQFNHQMDPQEMMHRQMQMQQEQQFHQGFPQQYHQFQNPNPQDNMQNQMGMLMGQLQQELAAIISFVKNIKPDDDEREEKVGEVLYEFILKLIGVFHLNNLNKPDITNQIISMKLTGILLQSEMNLVDILSDFNGFVSTLRDLISRIYESN